MEGTATAPRAATGTSADALLALAGGVTAAAFAPILIRYAEGADPLAISFWRCLAGAVVLAPFASRGLTSLTRTQAAKCALSGLFLALHFATWITSLEYTTVASSVLLVSTTPVFVALAAPWIVRERMTGAGWIGIALSLAGTAFIAGLDVGGSNVAGNLLALAGGAAAGGYVLTGRIVRRDLPILPYAVVTYGVAALVLLPVCVATNDALGGYPAVTVWALVALVAGPQLLGHTVINSVLSRIDATTVSVSFMSEPIIATGLAAWLFDEIPAALFYPGAVAILAGIYLVSTHQMPAREVAPA